MSTNTVFKAELSKPCGPWRTLEQVEIATLEYVDWFNHRRLFQVSGDIPPAELEQAHYRHHAALTEAGHSHHHRSPETPGGFTSPPNTAISVWPLPDPLLDWEVLT